jgi:hypothetical protein
MTRRLFKTEGLNPRRSTARDLLALLHPGGWDVFYWIALVIGGGRRSICGRELDHPFCSARSMVGSNCSGRLCTCDCCWRVVSSTLGSAPGSGCDRLGVNSVDWRFQCPLTVGRCQPSCVRCGLTSQSSGLLRRAAHLNVSLLIHEA